MIGCEDQNDIQAEMSDLRATVESSHLKAPGLLVQLLVPPGLVLNSHRHPGESHSGCAGVQQHCRRIRASFMHCCSSCRCLHSTFQA